MYQIHSDYNIIFKKINELRLIKQVIKLENDNFREQFLFPFYTFIYAKNLYRMIKWYLRLQKKTLLKLFLIIEILIGV